MVTRIHTMPVYTSCSETIDASLFNLWRRAHHHLNLPVRLKLPALKSMILILEDDCWVVVDPRHYDLPMIAWLNFQDTGRNSLHTPVECTVNYYHFMASQFHKKVLANIGEVFETSLK